mmetsp:Transcript_17473/g.38083  ORF Transcript_17473/g.38083 Transcript_17473/m.38083 type:complete len:90 (+) Transcript_17473:2330-2599(+)
MYRLATNLENRDFVPYSGGSNSAPAPRPLGSNALGSGDLIVMKALFLFLWWRLLKLRSEGMTPGGSAVAVILFGMSSADDDGSAAGVLG